MGRSPFFNVDSVTFPAEKPAYAAVLADLQPGQHVCITCNTDSEYSNRAHRAPSNYGCLTSSYDDTLLVVDHINIYPDLNKHGVRAIAFRDPKRSKDDHIYTWYATTDGFIRESEHFGIMQEIATVEVIK